MRNSFWNSKRQRAWRVGSATFSGGKSAWLLATHTKKKLKKTALLGFPQALRSTTYIFFWDIFANKCSHPPWVEIFPIARDLRWPHPAALAELSTTTIHHFSRINVWNEFRIYTTYISYIWISYQIRDLWTRGFDGENKTIPIARSVEKMNSLSMISWFVDHPKFLLASSSTLCGFALACAPPLWFIWLVCKFREGKGQRPRCTCGAYCAKGTWTGCWWHHPRGGSLILARIRKVQA